jgi:phosphonate transport system permease protein
MAKMTLNNGKTVVKPFNKIWIVLAVLIILVIGFWQFIRMDPGFRVEYIRLDQLGIIIGKLFTPKSGRDWGDLFRFMLTLKNPLLQTLKMCFAGTLIGSVLAFPLAIFSAKNIVKTPIVYWPMRTLMNLIRTIPTMVLAIIAVIFVGTGLLAGIIAISLFTFGIMSKMLYEVIETIDMSSYEALESTGANKIQSFRYAVLPQIFPIFLGYLLYIFEINIRSSAILAYVGAEGIGTPIKDNTLYNYDYVGATILVLLALILVIQGISGLVRRKLQ